MQIKCKGGINVYGRTIKKTNHPLARCMGGGGGGPQVNMFEQVWRVPGEQVWTRPEVRGSTCGGGRARGSQVNNSEQVGGGGKVPMRRVTDYD